jgi:hypothetical protein
MIGNILNLSLRRAIIGVKMVEWQRLTILLATISLGQSRDRFFLGAIEMDFFCLLNVLPFNEY